MIAIDLGSNTIRIIKYDCATHSKLGEFERIVKTADRLVETGGILDESIERIVSAIEDAKKQLDFNDEIKAVATEALRKAKNRDYVLEKIKEKTGIEFEIISPSEEAYFTAKAVEVCLEKCEFDNQSFLLVDIGGGSTELTLKHKDEIMSESFDMGIVTLTQKHKTPESIKFEIKKRGKEFKEFLDLAFSTYKKPKIFVASSGTPTTIAAVKKGMNYHTYDPQKVNGTTLTIEDLDFWGEKLLKMEMKKREELVGVGRGDLIISGIYIFKEIFKLSGYKECIVCDDGVREGVAIAGCEKI